MKKPVNASKMTSFHQQSMSKIKEMLDYAKVDKKNLCSLLGVNANEDEQIL
jgi:hypothetical protein